MRTDYTRTTYSTTEMWANNMMTDFFSAILSCRASAVIARVFSYHIFWNLVHGKKTFTELSVMYQTMLLCVTSEVAIPAAAIGMFSALLVASQQGIVDGARKAICWRKTEHDDTRNIHAPAITKVPSQEWIILGEEDEPTCYGFSRISPP